MIVTLHIITSLAQLTAWIVVISTTYYTISHRHAIIKQTLLKTHKYNLSDINTVKFVNRSAACYYIYNNGNMRKVVKYTHKRKSAWLNMWVKLSVIDTIKPLY